MNCDFFKCPRGRPKTFNREHVLDVAMQAYRLEGVDSVSVNAICKKASVSKPGLYREFNNEDGLMHAVLAHYETKVLTPMYQMLASDTPFQEKLDKIVAFTTGKDNDQQANHGCLMVIMRQARSHLGQGAQEQVTHIHQRVLKAYQDWFERSKKDGQFTTGMDSKLAASYIDTQIHCALSQLAQGEKKKTVKDVLTLSFSVLV